MLFQNESRWNDYVLVSNDEFTNFWKSFLTNKRKIAYFMGCGFDPRMCSVLENFIANNSDCVFSCKAIDYDEGSTSPSHNHDDIKKQNLEVLKDLTKNFDLQIDSLSVRDDSNNIQIRKIRKLVPSIDKMLNFTDIVVDISALPLYIYFPLIAKILDMLDKEKNKNSGITLPNLHVVVAENSKMDMSITQKELDQEGTLVYPFQSNLDSEDPEQTPRIWIPILGENQDLQLTRIYTMVKPHEITPFFPAVSSNPRRGDDIYLQHAEIFKKLSIDHRNIIYGSEKNPFEVYRGIISTINRYRNSLSPLGECKIALSSLSSKLLSMSSFLVAYEAKQENLEIAIAQVFSKGFSIDNKQIKPILSENEFFSLWIFGNCYDP